MAAYYALFEPEVEQGGFVVNFPDFPGCMTQGDSAEEALEMAVDALCLMPGHMAADGESIPPARIRRGKNTRLVTLPPHESAKLDLHRVFRASGVSKSELERRTGDQKSNIECFFDPSHPSRIELVDAAFRALGKRTVIRIEDAA